MSFRSKYNNNWLVMIHYLHWTLTRICWRFHVQVWFHLNLVYTVIFSCFLAAAGSWLQLQIVVAQGSSPASPIPTPYLSKWFHQITCTPRCSSSLWNRQYLRSNNRNHRCSVDTHSHLHANIANWQIYIIIFSCFQASRDNSFCGWNAHTAITEC